VQPQSIPFPQNRQPLATVIPLFLCPADTVRVVKEYTAPDGVTWKQRPSNYVACVGSNLDGDAAVGNGMFYQNSQVRVADVTDGTSHTVAFSESILGAGGPAQSGATGDPRLFYKSISVALDATACDASTTLTADRGALWADGSYNSGLYNNVRTPNSPQMDCVRHSNPAWKAARSHHDGGVNAVLGDGSVRFVSDRVNETVWREAGTRNGGEVPGEF
jgi:hypothetical protein